jgi:TusA-related sulfurtransferase
MKTRNSLSLILFLSLTISTVALVTYAAQQEQQAKPKPSEKSGDGHDMGAMNKRGNEQMGFSQDKATHHFRLMPDGGAIEVQANDAKDTATRDKIRMHLGHIAGMFAEGNFNAPMLIHDQTPPGVPVMKLLKAEIKYKFEEIERGGRVRITSNNPEALAAIYEFLRFQIKEHQTGDTLEVSVKP